MRAFSSFVVLMAVGLSGPAGAAAAGGAGAVGQSLFSDGCILDFGSIGISNCSPTGKAMADMRSIVVSPDGQNLYASSSDSDAVVIFDRDPTDGDVSQKKGGAGCIVNETSSDVT